jgi:hypothetical protein
MKRTSEAMAKSYWEAAMKLFPKLPPLVTERVQYSAGVAPTLKVFDVVFAKSRNNLLGLKDSMGPHKLWLDYLLINVSSDVDAFARLLHLDRRLELALFDRLYQLALGLKPDEKWSREHLEELAKLYRRLLELDKSTALLNRLASKYPPNTDAQELRHLAYEIDKNAKIAKLLHDAKHPEWVREYALLNMAHDADASISDYEVKNFLGDTLPPRALMELGKLRAWPHEDYLLVGEGPLWMLRGQELVETGPRLDDLRGSQVRYYNNGKARKLEDVLGVLDGVPRRDVSVRFHLSFQPASDWWPPGAYPKKTDKSIADTSYDRGRPQVGFLFGVRDVSVDMQEDPKTHQQALVRPLHAFGVRIRPDAVELVELTETKRKRGYLQMGDAEFSVTVLQSQKAALGGGEFDVGVEAAGDAVKVTVGGNSYSFAAPKERTGFYGLHFSGAGYAELSRLKVASRLQ